MTARAGAMLVTDGGRLLGTLTHVAELLGAPPSTVHRWVSARHLNGCPAPVDVEAPTAGHSPEQVGWYDVTEWLDWRTRYTVDRRPSAARCRAPGRGTATDAARLLNVPPRRVYKWVERRASNGCPAKGADGFYDLTQWVTWAAPKPAEVA